MKLSEAFESYYQVISFRNQSFKTAEMHWYAMKSLIKCVGDIEVSEFTFQHARKWKEKMEQEGKGASTIRGYVIKLRCVLVHLRRIKVDCMDVDEVPVPKREATVPSWITPEEVEQLIQACPFKRGKAIISLLYASGIRVSELVNLNRDQLHDGRFTVIGKGSKPRLCFYDERTTRLLDSYLRTRKDNCPALFIQRVGCTRLKKSGVEAIFRHTRVRAGFTKPITPHTLRHSFATDLAQQGIAIHNLQMMLGHSNLATTGMYLHTSNPRLEESYKQYHTPTA